MDDVTEHITGYLLHIVTPQNPSEGGAYPPPPPLVPRLGMSSLVHPRVKSSIQAPLNPPQRADILIKFPGGVFDIQKNSPTELGFHLIPNRARFSSHSEPSSVFISLRTGLGFRLIPNQARFSTHFEASSVFISSRTGLGSSRPGLGLIPTSVFGIFLNRPRFRPGSVVGLRRVRLLLTEYGLKTEVSFFDPSSVAQKHKLIPK